MPGILAVLALALAYIFHGAGFDPNAWFDWQGLVILGLLLLAWDAAWPRFEAFRTRRPVA